MVQNHHFVERGIISVLYLRVKKVNDICLRFKPMISIHRGPQAIHTTETSFAKKEFKFKCWFRKYFYYNYKNIEVIIGPWNAK